MCHILLMPFPLRIPSLVIPLIMTGLVAQDHELLVVAEDGSLEHDPEAEFDAGHVEIGVWLLLVYFLLAVGPQVNCEDVDVAGAFGDVFAIEFQAGVWRMLAHLRKRPGRQRWYSYWKRAARRVAHV